MQENSKQLTIIGRTAPMKIVSEDKCSITVKIDTGADSSSIWASELRMDDDYALSFCLFAKGSPYYTGKRHLTKAYSVSAVRSAHGTLQIRYKVQLVVRLGGKRVRGSFTLADRSKNTYPALIGCRLLNKKFLVDVAKGKKTIEREQKLGIKREFSENPRAFFEKYHSNNDRGDIQA